MIKVSQTNFRGNGGFSGGKDFKSLRTMLLSPSIDPKVQSNIICHLLGIKDGFLDKLESFEENIRNHEPVNDWLLIFLENSLKDIEDISLKSKLSEELLVSIGFQEGSDAVKTIFKRSKLILDHVDPIDAAMRFVIDEFKYNPVLSSVYGSSDSNPQWPSGVRVLNLPGVNVSSDGGTIIEDDSSRVQLSRTLSMICKDDLHTVLFHGTDLQSAQDICSDGIEVNCGFRRRDFSDGAGFYLTKSYFHARDWAFSQTQEPVVLGFKIPNACFKEAKGLDLKDESKQNQWQEIVSQNRAGKPTKKMRNFLRKYDFIEGPISVSSRIGDSSDRQNREANLESHQLCVISDDFAEELSKYLATILTYDEL